ncbi:hypothetical protein ACS0TY_014792 [Phlomoides rotata]
MENKKMDDSSSQPSSFTDLFGVKDSLPTSASNDLFSSIFAASSTRPFEINLVSVIRLQEGTTPPRSYIEVHGWMLDFRMIWYDFCRGALHAYGDTIKNKEDESIFIPSKKTNSYKKDGGVDDSSKNNSNGVARENWWQDRTRLPCPFLMDGKLRVWVLSKNLNCQVISFLSKTAFSATG